MEKIIYEKQITNDPLFDNVERWVQIFFLYANSDAESFEIRYRIKYIRDGVDISSAMSQIYPKWERTNNDLMMERDLETFEPIVNPDYDEEVLGSAPYKMKPAFSYVIYLLFEVGVPINMLFNMYIPEEDEAGRFDV